RRCPRSTPSARIVRCYNSAMHKCTNARMHQLALVHFCILAFSVFLLAQESDRSQTEALSRRADEQLQALQREANQLASEEKTLLGELRKLEIERELKTIQLRQLDSEVAQVETDLHDATDRMET